MLSRNRMFFALMLVIFVAIIIAIVLWHRPAPKANLANIQNFADCAAAGFPIMESFPRQCSLPNGKFFTEQNAGQECSGLASCPSGYACVNHMCTLLKPQ